ncbi:hypothetical protein CN495_08915 [Bacillus thuringiensis]|uniref:Uncharacterized protein n=1 Tax=Bacillus thuringiensis TaxID=1428 RepID=A0ABD6SLC3_BACTU|nr:hypothetical protein CN495_08915 [Bacillus thuringiensis]
MDYISNESLPRLFFAETYEDDTKYLLMLPVCLLTYKNNFGIFNATRRKENEGYGEPAWV